MQTIRSLHCKPNRLSKKLKKERDRKENDHGTKHFNSIIQVDFTIANWNFNKHNIQRMCTEYHFCMGFDIGKIKNFEEKQKEKLCFLRIYDFPLKNFCNQKFSILHWKQKMIYNDQHEYHNFDKRRTF